MATIKYRASASSPWQKVWVRITNFASEIFTSRGKTVEQELDEIKADMLQMHLHRVTETFTTSAYGWVFFPRGRMIINAVFDTYNYLLPVYNVGTESYIANVGIYVNNTGTFINLQPNTQYEITYTYF